MKKRLQLLLVLAVLVGGVWQTQAQGTAFIYQGQLQNNGAPANGLYDFQFSLSNSPSGGSQVGGTVAALAVGVTNGVFSAFLDFGSVYTGNPVWLAMSVRSNSVGNYVNLTPLQLVTPVPYSIFANTASNLSGLLPASQLSGVLNNNQLVNNTITLNPGVGLGGGGAVTLGGSTILSNAGVLSVTGNSDITVSTVGGAVTLDDNATSAGAPGTLVKRDVNGGFTAGTITATNLNGSFAGDGGSLTNIPLAGLQTAPLTNGQSGVTLSGQTTVSNLTATGTNFANYLVVSNAPTLNGSAITNLNAAQLAGGTVPLTQLNGITSNQLDAATWQLATNLNGGNAALASNVVIGLNLTNAFLTNAVLSNSVFSGDGSELTNLNASQLTTGTIPLAQLPAPILTNGQSGVALGGLTTVSNLAITGTNFVNYLVVSNPPVLNGSAITNLNASQLSGGIVPLPQLTGITSNQLDAATWQLATNLNGGNAALASNVVIGLNLTNAFLTNALLTNSVYAGDGSTLTNLNASQLTVGTLPLAQLPTVVLTNGQSSVILNGLTTVSNLAAAGTNFANYLVVSNAPSLDGGGITNLNAAQLTSGTVPLTQLTGITSNQLDVATWQLATNLNGGNAALASNVIIGLNLTNAFLTNAVISNSFFSGDASGLTNLNASQLTAGTIPLAQLSALVLTNGQSGVALSGLTSVGNLAVAGTNFANYITVSNAPTFDGSAITNLNASQLKGGTVPLSQLVNVTSNQLDAATWQLATNLNGGNAALASNVVVGLNLTNAFLTNAVLTNSVFAGDGAGLTNLNASQLTAGAIPLAQLPAPVLTNTQGGVTFSGLTTVSNQAVTGTNFANYLVVSNAPALDGRAITNLNASQLTGGIVPLTELAGITSNQLDAATWQLATNLNGGNAALASNVVMGLNLTNAFLTNATLTSSIFAGDGSQLTNLNVTSLVGVMTGNPPLSTTYGITNVFDGDSYTTGNGSLPYTMPIGVQQMTGIPSVNLGISGITTYGILTNFQSNTWAWGQPNIIWAGNNDQYAPTPITDVVSNIGVMVADMALSNNTRYLVLSTINDYTNQGPGTPGYIYLTSLNAMLAATFTNHYLDIRAWMIQNYNPVSPADYYGLTNDSPPASEWNIPVDHPNVLGESLIANKVLENAYWLQGSAPVTTASVQEQIQNALSKPVILSDSVTVTTISPQANGAIILQDPANGQYMAFNPSLEQFWSSTGALDFQGDYMMNISSITATTLTGDIDTSTNTAGFPPLFAASAAPNDGAALTNLNASQISVGSVPPARLPVATASSLGAVQPDGSTITVNNGIISTASPANTTLYITNAMIDGTPLNVTYAHGLATFPGFIHPILLCTASDAGTGMVAGQMTEFTSVFSEFSGVFAAVSYDTTNIYIQATGRAAAAGGFSFFSSGDDRPTSWSDFAIVVGYHQ